MTAHAYWRIKIITYGGGSAGTGFSNVMDLNFTDANGVAFSRSGCTALDSAHFSGTTFDAAKAVDANSGTTWSGNPTSGGYPLFYLGIHYTSAVDAFGVQMSDWDTSAPITFDVEYSDDGVTWTVRASGVNSSTWSTGSSGFGGDATLLFFDAPAGSGSHAYWRCLVSCKRRAFGGGNFFGNTGGIGFYDGSNTLLSTGGTALDNANFGTAPSAVFANPTGGSLWSGDFNAMTLGTGPAYLGYHFSTAVNVNHVTIYAYSGDTSQFLGFYLQYSDDGTTWTTKEYFPDFTAFSAGEHRTYTVSAVPPTGTADLEFGSVSLDAIGYKEPIATADLEFVKPSFALTAAAARAGTTDLEFVKPAFAVTSGHGPQAQADMEFGTISYGTLGQVIHVKGTVTMQFNNMTLAVAATVPSAAGTGVRQFWTFGG